MKNLFVLSTVILIICVNAHASYSDVCDFSHLAEEMPLTSEFTVDMTKKAQNNPLFWQKLQEVLPNLKHLYVSEQPYFGVMFGWAKSWDNFERFTQFQVEEYFSSMTEFGRSKIESIGGNYNYSFSSNLPFTMYVTSTYVDAGKPYKDIGIDVIVTPNCIVSLKISGRTDELNQEYWQVFDEQIELLRDLVRIEYDPVKFSTKGSRIWWSSLLNNLLHIVLAGLLAFVLSYIYRRKYILTPGSVTKRYTIFMTVWALVMISATIFINQWINVATYYRYESIPYFTLIFFVHIWAYLTNRPKIIIFALCLVVSALILNIVYWFLNLAVIKTNDLIGFSIGFVLVIYTLRKSSAIKRGVMKQSEIDNAIKWPIKNTFQNLWPLMRDAETAKKASRQGIYASLFIVCMTTLMVIFEREYFKSGAWALVDSSLFAFIAWRIYKMSRIASVLGLILYLVERVGIWVEYDVKGLGITFVIVLMFINSIRGTFAFHKFQQQEKHLFQGLNETNSGNES